MEDVMHKRAIRGSRLFPRVDYPIAPKDIGHVRIGDVFGKTETESACKNIVKYLQERDKGWEPFSLSEAGLSEYHPGIVDLLDRGLLIGWMGNRAVKKEDTFMVSHVLISMLFANAPSWDVVSTTQDGD